MKKILLFFFVLSLLTLPVYAQSDQVFPNSDYSSGYLDGYIAGYNAGKQDGFKDGLEFSRQHSSPSVTESSPTYSDDNANLKPVSAPSNGKILKRPNADMRAPLTIHTTGDEYYYFSLKKIGYSGCYMSFFGHGGKTVEVDVPVGTYHLYYATGETWYGTEHIFGPETSYYRCDDSFTFTKDDNNYNGWELTLYPVRNGNMDSESVSADDFPK